MEYDFVNALYAPFNIFISILGLVPSAFRFENCRFFNKIVSFDLVK